MHLRTKRFDAQPKTGTVIMEIGKAVAEVKCRKIDLLINW
jgi:hypothetical protein